MTEQINLIFHPSTIDSRLKMTPIIEETETFKETKSKITSADESNWIEACKASLQRNDLMKLDAQLSYRSLIKKEVYIQCLNEINTLLLQQFASTKLLLLDQYQDATDPVSKYYRVPVFHEILKELITVNPEIYNEQFDVFQLVEQRTKQQDRMRILKLQRLLPLKDHQKMEIDDRRAAITPVVEDDASSGGGWRLWLGIFLAVLAVVRLMITISRH